MPIDLAIDGLGTVARFKLHAGRFRKGHREVAVVTALGLDGQKGRVDRIPRLPVHHAEEIPERSFHIRDFFPIEINADNHVAVVVVVSRHRGPDVPNAAGSFEVGVSLFRPGFDLRNQRGSLRDGGFRQVEFNVRILCMYGFRHSRQNPAGNQ